MTVTIRQHRSGLTPDGLGVEPLEIEHSDTRWMGVGLGINHQVTEALGQRPEVAFGVDDRLLHPGGALFQQPAPKMGFARRSSFLRWSR